MDCQSEDDYTINHHANEEPEQDIQERRPPEGYDEWVYIAQEDNPITVKKALSSQDAAKWRKTMETELQSLHKNQVWELSKLPPGRKAIGSGYLNESLMLMKTLKNIKQGWLPKVIIRSMELIMMKYFVQSQD